MTTIAPSVEMRIEALRLATDLAHEYDTEPLELAARFAKFLAGNDATMTPVQIADAWPDNIKDTRGVWAAAQDERPVIDGLPWSEVVDRHQEAQKKARLRASRRRLSEKARDKSQPDKVDVYAQIMTIVHKSGVFADPEQLAADLGRVITEAEGSGK